MAQETQTGVLYQPRGVGCGGRWEGSSKGRGYMYTHGWFMLTFDRRQQNSVKQLSFNKKIERKKNKSHESSSNRFKTKHELAEMHTATDKSERSRNTNYLPTFDMDKRIYRAE